MDARGRGFDSRHLHSRRLRAGSPGSGGLTGAPGATAPRSLVAAGHRAAGNRPRIGDPGTRCFHKQGDRPASRIQSYVIPVARCGRACTDCALHGRALSTTFGQAVSAWRKRWDNPPMALVLRTPLCDRLGIDVPILSAGMGSVAGSDLVAAVSEAGGFGVLGVSGATPEVVQERIEGTRALTRRP